MKTDRDLNAVQATFREVKSGKSKTITVYDTTKEECVAVLKRAAKASTKQSDGR